MYELLEASVGWNHHVSQLWGLNPAEDSVHNKEKAQQVQHLCPVEEASPLPNHLLKKEGERSPIPLGFFRHCYSRLDVRPQRQKYSVPQLE